MEREALTGCVAAVRARGVDLAQYNSVAIAADVDAARRALGYERIVHYGASYGAQLGQHLMRDFPGILEAVVLDGANSLSRKSWIEERALDVDYSFGHITALCEADARCKAANDLPALVEKGLALFDEGPITASFTDPKEPGKTYPLEVTRSQFVMAVYELLGYKIGVASLPAALQMLVEGGRQSMGEGLARLVGDKLLQQRDAPGGGMAGLMHMTVVCSDDPVRSPDELVLDGAVNVPTLILSGGLDAQTPTFRSEVVARSLPDARLVVFPDGTHVQLGAINLCAGSIMTSFIQDTRRRAAAYRSARRRTGGQPPVDRHRTSPAVEALMRAWLDPARCRTWPTPGACSPPGRAGRSADRSGPTTRVKEAQSTDAAQSTPVERALRIRTARRPSATARSTRPCR